MRTIIIVFAGFIIGCGTVSMTREIREGSTYGPGLVTTTTETMEIPAWAVPREAIHEMIRTERETEYR